VNVVRLVDGFGLIRQLGKEVPGIFCRIFQVDGGVAIPVNADGQNIKMRLIGRAGGQKTGCAHRTLHCVGSIEGGKPDLVLTGNRFHLQTFFEYITLCPQNDGAGALLFPDGERSHIPIHSPAVQLGQFQGCHHVLRCDFTVESVGLDQFTVLEQTHLTDAAARALHPITNLHFRIAGPIGKKRNLYSWRRVLDRFFHRQSNQTCNGISFQLCRDDVGTVKYVIELINTVNPAASADIEEFMAPGRSIIVPFGRDDDPFPVAKGQKLNHFASGCRVPQPDGPIRASAGQPPHRIADGSRIDRSAMAGKTKPRAAGLVAHQPKGVVAVIHDQQTSIGPADDRASSDSTGLPSLQIDEIFVRPGRQNRPAVGSKL